MYGIDYEFETKISDISVGLHSSMRGSSLKAAKGTAIRQLEKARAYGERLHDDELYLRRIVLWDYSSPDRIAAVFEPVAGWLKNIS